MRSGRIRICVESNAAGASGAVVFVAVVRVMKILNLIGELFSDIRKCTAQTVWQKATQRKPTNSAKDNEKDKPSSSNTFVWNSVNSLC